MGSNQERVIVAHGKCIIASAKKIFNLRIKLFLPYSIVSKSEATPINQHRHFIQRSQLKCHQNPSAVRLLNYFFFFFDN